MCPEQLLDRVLDAASCPLLPTTACVSRMMVKMQKARWMSRKKVWDVRRQEGA